MNMPSHDGKGGTALWECNIMGEDVKESKLANIEYDPESTDAGDTVSALLHRGDGGRTGRLMKVSMRNIMAQGTKETLSELQANRARPPKPAQPKGRTQ